jgi:hypothetical protein
MKESRSHKSELIEETKKKVTCHIRETLSQYLRRRLASDNEISRLKAFDILEEKTYLYTSFKIT